MKKGREIKEREIERNEKKTNTTKVLACETPVFPTRTLLFSSRLERAAEALPCGLQCISVTSGQGQHG